MPIFLVIRVFLFYLKAKKRNARFMDAAIKNTVFLIPEIFSEKISSSSSFSVYSDRQTENYSKIMRDIRNGKHIVLEKTDPAAAEKLYCRLESRADELISFNEMEKLKAAGGSRPFKIKLNAIRESLLDRILITAENERVTSFTDEVSIRALVSFCGEDIYSYTKVPFIIPYRYFRSLVSNLKDSLLFPELNLEISAGNNVLLPRSKETTALFYNAINELSKKESVRAVDMGCGSGILSLAADRLLSSSEIYFSDILPESAGSAILNIENNTSGRFMYENGYLICRSERNSFICCRTGDLFENTDDRFDLIIFNPPWVNAECRNRSEKALNDKDQITVKRFLIQARNYLENNGRILLAYSDNGGDKAVDNLDSLINETGLITEKEYSARVQSRQSGRSWMKIMVRVIRK